MIWTSINLNQSKCGSMKTGDQYVLPTPLVMFQCSPDYIWYRLYAKEVGFFIYSSKILFDTG